MSQIVKGFLYKGEEVKQCPKCDEKLMWYLMPDSGQTGERSVDSRREILVCSSMACDYPFDPDYIEEYEIRGIDHGKELADGAPDDLCLPPTATDNQPGVPFTAGSQNQEVIPYGSMQDNNQALVEALMRDYKDGRMVKVEKPNLDADALRAISDIVREYESQTD